MARDLARLGKEELISTVRSLEKRIREAKDRQRLVRELRVQQQQVRSQQIRLQDMQMQLDALRGRVADLFEHAPVAYLLIEPQGRIVDANASATALLGLERRRLTGSPLHSHTPADDHARLSSHLRRCRQGEALVRTEVALHGRTGRRLPVELASRPWREPGREPTLFHTAMIDLGAYRGARLPGEGEAERPRGALYGEASREIVPPAGRRLVVLLVEGHGDTAIALAAMLGLAGHRVVTVASGDEALARVGDGIDVVVSDLGFPDGHGLDLVRELRERAGEVPAIALGGGGSAAEVERSLAAGFERHLTKPVDPPTLMAAIAAVLQRPDASHG